MSGEPPVPRAELEEFLRTSAEPFGHFVSSDGEHWLLERSMVEWFLNELPQPSQQSLDEITGGVRRLRFLEGGCRARPLGQKVVLEISDPGKLAELGGLLRLVADEPRWHCMCLGDYALELQQQDGSLHYLGFHHGKSLRRDEVWGGDATLAEPRPLLEWLAAQGLGKPLQGFLHDQRLAAEALEKARAWLAAGPEALREPVSRWFKGGQSKQSRAEVFAAAALLPPGELVPQLLGWLAYRLDSAGPVPEYEAMPAWILDELKPTDVIEGVSGELSWSQKMGLAVVLFQPSRLPLLLEIPKKVRMELLALLPGEGSYQFGEQLPLDYQVLLAGAPRALLPLLAEVWQNPRADYSQRFFGESRLKRIQELIGWTARFAPRSYHAFRTWLQLVDSLLVSIPLEECKPVLLGCTEKSTLKAAVARHLAEAPGYPDGAFADFPKALKGELMKLVAPPSAKTLGKRLAYSSAKKYWMEVLKVALAVGLLYWLHR